jgi:chromosome segregation ATPase
MEGISMHLGKKLSTLINATLRGGLPRGRRRFSATPGDPEAQLETVRRALADVEAKERAVADRLQETQDRLNEAIEQGDEAEVSAQRRLARELESHLQTQSTEALRLSEKLAVIEDRLAEELKRTTQKLADAQESVAQAAAGGQEITSSAASQPLSQDDTAEDTASDDDDDLAARKSRLS